MTENIRKELDDANKDCGGFVDLHKAFYTIDHQVLFAKWGCDRIRGVSYDWFKSYRSNRNHYVSIKSYNSILVAVNCRVNQGSVIGQLLGQRFIIYKRP